MMTQVEGRDLEEALTMRDLSRVIKTDEETHLTVLQAVAQTLGGSTSATDGCQFNFSSALTSVETFLATARILEYVGIDA